MVPSSDPTLMALFTVEELLMTSSKSLRQSTLLLRNFFFSNPNPQSTENLV
jgi:hypothetical protein